MTDVYLLGPAKSISFHETPSELPEVQRLLEAWWKQFSIEKPSLFNGRVLACRECELSPGGTIRIAWYETDYAHYMQRVASSPIATPARAIFCSVALRATSGDLLVGRMAENTSSPGRLQLPGGNVTIDRTGLLSADSCAVDACREFQEEVGISLLPTQLVLWRVKVGGRFDDVGIIYLCDLGMSEQKIREAFNLHARAEKQAGVSTEFDELLFVNTDYFLSATERDWVDYLPSVASQLGQPPTRGKGS